MTSRLTEIYYVCAANESNAATDEEKLTQCQSNKSEIEEYRTVEIIKKSLHGM